MTIWNVLAAAVASWALGLAWYALFAGARAKAAGGAGRPVGLGRAATAVASALVMLIVAGFLRHVFFVSGLVSGIPLALVAGMGVGLFFIGPWLAMTCLADGRPLRLTLIDGGFATVATGVMGALLVAF